MAKWNIKRGERVVGPIDTNYLKKIGLEGKLLPTDLIQKVGTEKWVAARNVRGLSLAHASTPQNKDHSVPKSTQDRQSSLSPVLTPVFTDQKNQNKRVTRAAPDNVIHSESRQYQHSGTIPPLGAVASIISGLLAAFGLSLIYTAFIIWIPLIYFNVIATACFGGLIGLCVGSVSKFGHIRNISFVTVTSIVSSLIGIYAEWAYTIVFLFDSSVGLNSFSPQNIFAAINALYREGSWSLASVTVSGPFLLVVWIIEWIIIVFCSFAGSYAILGKQPYCETCQSWTATHEGRNRLVTPDSTTVLEQIKVGDFQPLNGLRQASKSTPSHWRIDIASCPSCQQANYLTINVITVTLNEKKEIKENSDEILACLKINHAEQNFLTECGLPSQESMSIT